MIRNVWVSRTEHAVHGYKTLVLCRAPSNNWSCAIRLTIVRYKYLNVLRLGELRIFQCLDGITRKCGASCGGPQVATTYFNIYE